MRIINKLILSILVLIAGILLGGVWPYLPSWIGLKFSVTAFFLSIYLIYKIWKGKSNEEVNKIENNLSSKINSVSDRLESNIKSKTESYFRKFNFLIYSFTKNQKKFFLIFIGWNLLNIIFFFNASENKYRKDYFWPLDRNSNLKQDYGILELLVYVIVPSLIFYFYNYLNKPKNKI